MFQLNLKFALFLFSQNFSSMLSDISGLPLSSHPFSSGILEISGTIVSESFDAKNSLEIKFRHKREFLKGCKLGSESDFPVRFSDLDQNLTKV